MTSDDPVKDSQSTDTPKADDVTSSVSQGAIKTKILEKMKMIKDGGADGLQFAADLQAAAVKATINGSADWEDYMKLIVGDDVDLLAKLKPLPEDPTNPEVFKRNLALSYLIGNGNCGATSTGGEIGEETGLIYGVGDELDGLLPTAPANPLSPE